ncbi:MAG TPA: RluA family pseudouridine synthase [Polyangia bacterium]|nr:RluA family pseudouridine synthase [Polyangia bacterium]
MKKRVFQRWADDPPVLDHLIEARLGVTRSEARVLVARGSVQIDGRRATNAERTVSVGEKVAVHTGPLEVPPPLIYAYRDHDLAIVDKPAGLPSQPEPKQEAHSLTAAVTRELGVDARAMHRLDKEASGLVVVALQREMYERLQRAFAEHAIDRRYLAVAGGELVGDETVRARIGRHPRDQRLRAALPENGKEGDPACTHVRSLGHGTLDGAPITAVELVLETGRTHQIRVHLQSIGHPLVGDAAYGGAKFERLCLHAYAVELAHPRTGKPLRVSTALPEAFVRLVPRLTSPFR